MPMKIFTVEVKIFAIKGDKLRGERFPARTDFPDRVGKKQKIWLALFPATHFYFLLIQSGNACVASLPLNH